MRTIVSILLVVLLLSCEERATPLTAQQIVDKAIDQSCQGKCDDVTIDFTFRKTAYHSSRNAGQFLLERTKVDSANRYVDRLTNKGFTRIINGDAVAVVDTTAVKLGDAVNSVHYFAQLPYGLNAGAANKQLLGEVTVKEVDYYVVGVTFNEEGGGTDYDDTFVYWFSKDDFSMDYFAYSYAVNGGGIRFREAYNPRIIEGIKFVDYNNYKPASLQTDLTDLVSMFEKNELKLLSKIETEDVKVTLQ